ncbi:Ferredoxin subunit of nitrite reductase or a ring-hydroxylating dioxygenase [Halogranum amylolyticum]|uniref:Ferredoxin subunit of nitrite reductase or a ring-hydroxylating dioxygenase n=1 Tax=Halogranum amylolyticum TaxID=660520 RepID=A0A1H8WU29_9EURY|nr:Rieske 2Fe-2S domain-containing protein [Halogranum amylolyticum]SEP31165.1 Ferredoxin subunit of nitrite reductase or a ring-hydroxylating dioxygenase [Halogranum amylolyticum]
MNDATRLAALSDISVDGSLLVTVREADGSEEEVIVVRTDDCVAGWKNFCQHETDQRLDRGFGAAIRGGEIVCPKHGSMFDGCSGYCDSGKAAESTLVEVEVAVEEGVIYLTDDQCSFLHKGGIDEDDGTPGSSSHLTF